MKFIPALLLLLSLSVHLVSAQTTSHSPKPVKFDLDESGDHYVRFTGLAQIWLRHTQMNPGTTIFSSPADSYSDISIRRLRFQVYGQLTDNLFVYTQFGINNFNYHSAKFSGAFFHDALVEYRLAGPKLSVGGGLTAWGGVTRHSTPSIGSIMTLDAPLYQQHLNGVNDQFVRKLSLYIKGQLGKLDYRLAVSQPMSVVGVDNDLPEPVSQNFSFSSRMPEKQVHGYFKYMFLDPESNLTPYEAGTYLGGKTVFNLGAGFLHQGNATWALDESGETDYNDLTILGVDAFLDKPVGNGSKLITIYTAFTWSAYGDGYLRYLGVDNAATGGGLPDQPGSFGNAFPINGNGSTFYAQAGYMFGNNILLENGKLQPFASVQLSDFDRLSNQMMMYEAGFNYLLHGTHNAKVSLMYQSRPVYLENGNDLEFDSRKGMTVIQLQAAF